MLLQLVIRRLVILDVHSDEAGEKAIDGDGQLVTGDLGTARWNVESVKELGPA